MKTWEEAKAYLEELGDLQEHGMIADFPCPCCGRAYMDKDLSKNVLSHSARVYICSECGQNEVIRMEKDKKPKSLLDWIMVKGLPKK